ncbi:MAG: dinitrogenase iron-molybdenum cofactor biosynthesis protein [Calothrix sp. C42_A2020_038]|nr:dinitrogenase iron-molybdenum cofactor biosynthesis protein [Calothrix sp. C42_A2020_038]
MKVAFATTDRVNINSDFGNADKFDIYEISKSGYEFLDTIKIDKEKNECGCEAQIHQQHTRENVLKANKGETDNEIATIINVLNDCTIVYFTSIGGIPAAKLIKKGINPMTPELDEEGIISILDRLLLTIKGNPAPWLRKALQQNHR